MDNMMFYNKHYVTVNEFNVITHGWSDGPNREMDTTNAICINEQGGYQFRLFPDGEENPQLFGYYDGYFVPIYKLDGTTVVNRTQDEIDADLEILMQPTAEQVRAHRDELLDETDWTQIPDAPVTNECKEAFRIYRQELRDVPQQEGFPINVVWPVMPDVVKA